MPSETPIKQVEPASDHLERSLHRRALLLTSLLGAAVLLLGLGVFASNLCIGAVSALLVPLLAVAIFFVGLLPPGFSALDAGLVRFARRARSFMRCVAVVCFLCGGAVALNHLAIARAISLSTVSASQIRGVMQGISVYCQHYGDYPAGLVDLLDERSVTPKQLLCPFDRAADETKVEREGYSSYVYSPGRGLRVSDPAIILLYERLPWSYGRATWCCPPGYEVGFADGTVRWLSVDEMTEALSRDAARRETIGWPVARSLGRLPGPSTTSPVSSPAMQTAPVTAAPPLRP